MSSSGFDDGVGGFSSQRFESFSSFTEDDDDGEASVKQVVDGDSPNYSAGDDLVFVSHPEMETQSPSPPPANSSGRSGFSQEGNGNGPILPHPEALQPEEGYALREWRRENAIRLEEKEKREKEILREIIEEANEFKAEYYRKWNLRCENNRATNREKEKLFLDSQEKFHAEASTNKWKAIAELIPKEIPTIEKKGKKKDQEEKRPSILVIQGPKPGKPTDLSRMRHILVKLKHNQPPRMNPPSPSPSDPTKNAKTGSISPAAISQAKSHSAVAEPSSTDAK